MYADGCQAGRHVRTGAAQCVQTARREQLQLDRSTRPSHQYLPISYTNATSIHIEIKSFFPAEECMQCVCGHVLLSLGDGSRWGSDPMNFLLSVVPGKQVPFTSAQTPLMCSAILCFFVPVCVFLNMNTSFLFSIDFGLLWPLLLHGNRYTCEKILICYTLIPFCSGFPPTSCLENSTSGLSFWFNWNLT